MKWLAAFFAVLQCASGQSWVLQQTGVKASLRGLGGVSSKVAWASGSGGTWLRTVDGGVHWETGVVPGAEKLDFRGLRAFDARNVVLVSAGTGDLSRVYSTSDAGVHWRLLFTNPDATGFFDAIAFRDSAHGVILGDPVGGMFTVFTTADGGKTWQRRKLPPALPGEGAFAASNTSLVLRGDEVLFATGGPRAARVFRSPDFGATWVVSATPVRHDEEGTGIFSLAFSDSRNAIAVGGKYSNDTDTTGTGAITVDGASSWTTTTLHGYRSSVAWVPDRKIWIAAGTSGSDVSTDGGRTWRLFDSGAFHALSVAGDGAVWASGPVGRIALLK